MGAAPHLSWVRIGPAPADANANHCKSTGKNECKLDYPVVSQPLFVLQFDRFLAPSSVARVNYSLVSGTSKDLAFKQIRVDPVERAVIFSLDGPLQPSVEYKLVIRPADREADRLAAYDGTPFEGPYTISFTTGSNKAAETDIDPGIVDPCEASKRLFGSCAGVTCHGYDLSTPPPAMGLSFASNAAIQGTAVGKAAAEVQVAASPKIGSPSAPFPYGMQLIVPNDSAASFLMYKILMDPRFRDSKLLSPDTPFPMTTIAQAPQTPRQMSALGDELSKVIPGAPMPHPDSPDGVHDPYEPLSIESLRIIRAWIDQGAPACGGSTMGDAGVLDGGSDASLDATDGAPADGDAAEGG